MPNVLANIARMTSATTGTGTLTLGSAVTGCLSFADSGITNGQVVTYCIEDYSEAGAVTGREVGVGTYTASGTTLSRTTVYNSTAGGTTKINCSGRQHVFITVAKQDMDARQPQENGFENRTDSSISFNNGNRTLTITPTGTSFSYFTGNTKYTKSGAEGVAITDTEGLHYVYYDGPTLLVTTTFTPSMITTYAFVAAIYWDADNNLGLIVADERHGSTMDSQTHLYNHLTFGARYGNGLALSSVLVDQNGSSNTHAQFGVSSGEIWDEDIQFTITAGSPQTLAAPAQIPVFYRSGASGAWRKVNATTYPLTTTGTGRMAWNQFTGGSWALAEITNGQYGLMHYLATTNILEPIIAITGQAQYATLTAAQTAAKTEMLNLSTGALASLSAEFVPIATLIFETQNSYSNAVKTRIRSTDTGASYIDWRSSRNFATSGISSNAAMFSTVSVSGQSDVVADTVSDTLTLAAGSNITITTNAGTDTITIATTGLAASATTDATNASNIGSGTLDAARLPQFTGGDVTTSAAGSVNLQIAANAVGTTEIADNAVTLAKMADMATGSLIYRKTAGTGDPEVQTLATLKTDLGLTGTNSGDQTITLTGDVTGSGTGSFTATIANDAVTYAKIQNVSATDRILGRSTAGPGDVEEITCTAAGRALIDDADATAQRTTLGLAIGTNVQAYDADLAALAGISTNGVLARTGAGTAAARTITGTAPIAVTNGDGVSGNPTISVSDITNTQIKSDADIAAGKLAFTHSATGGNKRVLQAKFEEVFNVRDFGATGNGSTNDRAAIQEAIDAASALTDGGVVYFPAGSYRVDSTCTITKSNVTLRGDGVALTWIINGTPNAPAIKFGNGTNAYYRNSISNMIFGQASGVTAVAGNCGLMFDMPNVGQATIVDISVFGFPSNLHKGIILKGTWQTKVTRIAVQSCLSHGVSIENCGDIYLASSRSDANGGSGFFFDGSEGCYGLQCTAYDNNTYGWQLQSSSPTTAPNKNNFFVQCIGDLNASYNWAIVDSKDTYFTNCWGNSQRSTAVNTFASGFYVASQNSNSLFFTGCIANNNNDNGFTIYDPGSSAPQNIHLVNCQFGSTAGGTNGNGRSGAGYGLYLDGASDKIRVIGGTFAGNADGAIRNLSSGTDILFESAVGMATNSVSIDTKKNFYGDIDVANGQDIIVGTTTGTRIGTASNQKLGFFGVATPVVQPALTADLLDSLQGLGLIASGSGNTPLNLTDGALTAGAIVGKTVGTSDAITTAWQFSTASSANVTLANGASATIPSGSGLLMVQELTTGQVALYSVGGGYVRLVDGDSTLFVTGSPGAGDIGVEYSGGVYKLTNNVGSTQNFRVGGIAIRSSN